MSVSHAVRAGFHVTGGWCREEPFDIFDDHQSWVEFVDGVGHVRPQSGAGVGGQAGAAARRGDVLAGEAAGEDVDRPVLIEDGLPVDLGDVAQVGNLRPVPGEDLRRVLVEVFLAVLVGRLVLGVPDHFGVVDVHDGQVQGPGAGEQGADSKAHAPAPFR